MLEKLAQGGINAESDHYPINCLERSAIFLLLFLDFWKVFDPSKWFSLYSCKNFRPFYSRTKSLRHYRKKSLYLVEICIYCILQYRSLIWVLSRDAQSRNCTAGKIHWIFPYKFRIVHVLRVPRFTSCTVYVNSIDNVGEWFVWNDH